MMHSVAYSGRRSCSGHGSLHASSCRYRRLLLLRRSRLGHCCLSGVLHDRLRLVLANFKSNLQHGFFVVIHTHFPIILVVLFVLEQCDTLLVSVQSAIEDNELGDRDAANVRWQASSSAYQIDVLIGDLSGQRHFHWLHLSAEVVRA